MHYFSSIIAYARLNQKVLRKTLTRENCVLCFFYGLVCVVVWVFFFCCCSLCVLQMTEHKVTVGAL